LVEEASYALLHAKSALKMHLLLSCTKALSLDIPPIVVARAVEAIG
jgi:hypothetical protein